MKMARPERFELPAFWFVASGVHPIARPFKLQSIATAGENGTIPKHAVREIDAAR